MPNSRNEEQDTKASEPKKISLQEVIKQKLASKKQEQQKARSAGNPIKQQKMRDQLTKRPNNQRRRTGV